MLKIVAENPAITTPATVPPVATTVFLVGPPMRYMVTSVVMMHTNTATQKGEYPRYTSGRYTNRMHKKVNTSPRAPFSPCFPPTRQSTTR